jgi:hypothetical protein
MPDLEKYAKQITSAEERADAADRAYRKGGSLESLNRANRALADAWASWRECSGGNVKDDRR